ncbi:MULTISPECIES: HNH endonuclease signature motif containing protein [unclassified Azospirillum]|uniref:HNH endonuclease signature motif containing protein n=1 Tax=unclassified Azospirillum TaxID=2630922 RepID=UPI000B77CF06|nr:MULTISPECIES: HNH endonuclease signature motif containing protein [unclassified Azospirillum]
MDRLKPLPPPDLLPRARAAPTARELGPCGLCGRPMLDGPSVDAHHLLPRSQGGRDTVMLHRVCHRKIHAELSEKELARQYTTLEALRAHPDIADFIRWVVRKPPEFTAVTFRAKDHVKAGKRYRDK